MQKIKTDGKVLRAMTGCLKIMLGELRRNFHQNVFSLENVKGLVQNSAYNAEAETQHVDGTLI